METQLDPTSFISSTLDFLKTRGLELVVPIIIIVIIERAISFMAGKYVVDEAKRIHIRKWTRYAALIFALVWVFLVYSIHREKDVYFMVGIFLAGVLIALRDVFSNFVGWILVVSTKGFQQGDRIKIGTVSGDVVDVGLLRTVLAEIGEWVDADQSTGRLVSVPNSQILTQPLFNYTQGHDFVWNEFKVLVTFESDWQDAEKIMLEVASNDFQQKKEHILEKLKVMRRRYMLRYNYISPKVYVCIADSGVLLTLRYMVRARRRRTLDDLFAREILSRFNRERSIEFAYPTMRIFRPGTGSYSEPQSVPSGKPDIKG